VPRGLRCRGGIRDKESKRDVVITGPRLRVVYSGCRWNSVVFATDAEFEAWLHGIWQQLQSQVTADPGYFKVTGRNGPGFPSFIVTQSSNPDMYADEIRCRLATERTGKEINDVVCTAILETNGERIDPSQVWSGSHMTPVFRLGYYKEGDNFGLTLTVLRAEYEPSSQTRISNEDWMLDI